MLVETVIHTGRGFQILEIYEWNVDFYILSGGNWYNNQINARALIGPSAMVLQSAGYPNSQHIESSGFYRWPAAENERILKATEYEYMLNLVSHINYLAISVKDETHSHTRVGSR